jgi:raffinose/stachyose/melibiose transport system permease protein
MRLTGRTAALLASPAIVIYAAFLLYPAVRGLLMSFTDARGVTGGHFIGLGNYRKLFTDPAVTAALRNSVVFTVVIVVVQNGLALGLAYWLHAVPAVRRIVRPGLLLPAMMSSVIVGFIWSYIYSPLGGPLNAVMDGLGLHRLETVWLGDTRTALLAVAVANIWMFLGYSTTIFLSNYLTIPQEIFEAAKVDGATGWRRFRRIDWRLLAPSLTINLTLSVIGTLRIFEFPLIMTNGGPADATRTLNMVIYSTSFQRLEFGYGTALAAVLLLLTLVIAFPMVALLRRREVTY